MAVALAAHLPCLTLVAAVFVFQLSPEGDNWLEASTPHGLRQTDLLFMGLGKF